MAERPDYEIRVVGAEKTPLRDAYQYNELGQQTVRVGPQVKGGRQEITYNDFGLPTLIRQGTSTRTDTTFAYDPMGQRVRKATPTRTTITDSGRPSRQ